ncbi:unnamed protein product [Sympodiomycopsis kandeliae]
MSQNNPSDADVLATLNASPPCSPKGIENLPNEILIKIAHYLTEKKELEALAFTSKTIQQVIEPFVQRHTIWSPDAEFLKIASNTYTANSVRRVIADWDPRSDDVLLDVLPRMHRLRSLTWCITVNPELDMEEFWSRLWSSCPELSDLTLGLCGTESSTEMLRESAFFALAGLSKFTLYYSCDVSSETYSRLFRALVERCPTLEELRIAYFPPRNRDPGTDSDVDPVPYFQGASWPKLQILELHSFFSFDRFFETNENDDGLYKLLHDHPSIRELHLTHPLVEELPRLSLSDGSLPNLQAFYGNVNHCLEVLRHGTRPIKKLSGFTPDVCFDEESEPWTGELPYVHDWTSTPRGQCLLEAVEASRCESIQCYFDGGIQPNTDLERFFHACRYASHITVSGKISTSLKALLPMISQLQSVTELSFPLHNTWMSNEDDHSASLTFIEKIKKQGRMIASVCPKLQEIYLGDDQFTLLVHRSDSALASEEEISITIQPERQEDRKEIEEDRQAELNMLTERVADSMGNS